MAIEAAHYGETRTALVADPIIIAMAQGLAGIPLAELQHEDGGPVWQFMSAASDEYHKRGGTIQAHIGGPAEALLILLNA